MFLLSLSICGSGKGTFHSEFQGLMGGWVGGWMRWMDGYPGQWVCSIPRSQRWLGGWECGLKQTNEMCYWDFGLKWLENTTFYYGC